MSENNDIDSQISPSRSNMLRTLLNEIMTEFDSDGLAIVLTRKKAPPIAVVVSDENSLLKLPSALTTLLNKVKEKRDKMGQESISSLSKNLKNSGVPDHVIELVEHALQKKMQETVALLDRKKGE